ncbi:alpha/beta-hydrolase [Mollisia scopiformis]|uniref:Carboxylic ester hydrolase n=1 Tax=Mollisia scopiformis TaxID=149040 RepID=A0A194WT95_MOLSC|nr:alpha/beta-hydrolase [Mollisia scopiformis]KUJ11171.1 alpha/beta-hydrolase [Mollisia scopiformis]
MRGNMVSGTGLLQSLLVLGVASVKAANSSLPIVDLGYAFHQAQYSISNQSNVYYNFSNIRYAAPPLGNLRFAATEAPLNNRSAGVQDGSYGNICPQAFANWQIGALSLNPGASNENEDCLFLDVVVPQYVYDNKASKSPSPVIVWFYGGGFTLGSKYSAGNPTGLLDQSLDTESKGQVWVGFNYRLGAMGWMNGPDFAVAGGTPNAGLYDQQMALQWVQDNIHLFGGDPSQVTVMGESAGGGSITHHITAYGAGNNTNLFQQAILQSPAFIPTSLKNTTNTAFANFLVFANVSTLEEARQLDTLTLQTANKKAQALAFYGTFSFGPAPDGTYVPDLPGKLLLEGKYNKNLSIIAAHNTNEAGHYTPPTASTSSNFTTYMKLYFPAISATTLNYLDTVLFPAIYNGSYPWTTPFQRLDTAISDFTFICSTRWLANAYGDKSHNYIFSVLPGNHTQDIPYTFFNGPISTVKNDTLAVNMQRYFTMFVENGSPNRLGLDHWVETGSEGKVMNFNATFTDTRVDTETVNERCTWWQKALYGDDWA